MNLIKKLNKILGVMIAGLAVTIIVVASKKGLIKWSNIFNHDNSKRLEEEYESELHSELIDNYQEYVDRIASEIKQIGRDGSITDVFAVYEYLSTKIFY